MRILTFLGIFPLMALSLCGGWDARLAASYLDARQQEWLRWPPAKATGGTCLSCHTGATYLLARPALRRVLGESRPTSYETGLLEGLRARAGLLEAKEVSPAFAAEPLGSQCLGVEAVFAALFLSLADTGGATLDADAQKGFDRLWSLQLRQGPARGAWPWFNLDLDPYEMPNSLFYGAAVAALAAGNAPAEYRKQPKAARRSTIEEIWRKQEADGGWTIDSLGPWKKHPGAPVSKASNSYATGLIASVLEAVDVNPADPRLARALALLEPYQGRRGGYWEAGSMNKQYEPGSMQAQFMRDAATAFAALALSEAWGR